MKKIPLFLFAIAFTVSLRAQNTASVSSINQEPIFTTDIDVMPEYKDGMDKFYSRVANIPYTYFDRVYSCEGRVTVMMIIEKDGSLSNLKVVHGFSEKQDKEILRVIKRLHQWKPGLKNGQPVRVLYSLPIEFKLVSA